MRSGQRTNVFGGTHYGMPIAVLLTIIRHSPNRMCAKKEPGTFNDVFFHILANMLAWVLSEITSFPKV
jgi:hypothetical protein